MSLVADYESENSEEENLEIEEPPKKKFKLPNPLKSANSNENSEVTDDPALHDFRIRSFPHVRGNWATYAYIQPPKELDFEQLQKELIDILKSKQIEAKTIPNPHLSVSKVVTLQHIWIKSFTESFHEKIRKIQPFRISLTPNVQIFVNDDKTRTFFALEIAENSNLQKIVKLCDDTLLEFKKEPFYENPQFHISLVWSLGQVSVPIQDLNQAVAKWLENQDQAVFEVNSVHCKIGNKFFELEFS